MASVENIEDGSLPSPTENTVVTETETETKPETNKADETAAEETPPHLASAPAPDASSQADEKRPSDASSIVDPQGESEQNTQEPGASPDVNIGNSKGAKILLNRFSNWKETTKQKGQEFLKEQGPTIQEKANRVWKQAPSIPRFPPVPRTTPSKSEDAAKMFVNMSTDAPDKEKTEGTANSAGNETDVMTTDDKAPGGPQSDDFEDLLNIEGKVGKAISQASKAATKATVAASVVAETVTTNFRGRYNAGKSEEAEEKQEEEKVLSHPSRTLPESQTELILKSRVGEHMQEIIDNLEPHQFAMLLGRGMLGTNLKQCYLKNHGVYVDYLVAGGQAEASRIIRSGDLLVKLGDVDLRKQTIVQIPKEIAKSRRPAVLILSQGTPVPVERMNYLDIAVAMMHRARYVSRKKGAEGDNKDAVCENPVPVEDSNNAFLTPPAPTMELRKEFEKEVTLRCNDDFDMEELLQVASEDDNFRNAVRNAFLTCALDSRRLSFLVRHLSDNGEVDDNGPEGSLGPNAQFMLFLELVSFLDLYHLTPPARLKEMTSRIAYKFFLPTSIGSGLQPPLFDFHTIVPDSSLRHLEFVLGGKTPNQSIPKDVFLDFLKAVVDSLTGAPFLSFLNSNQCARMRAFMRNTAPYVNLPLGKLVDDLVSKSKEPGARNSFSYIIVFLLYQLEKEPIGEHRFSKEEVESKRIVGAPNDICCSIFIKRAFVPELKAMKESFESKKALDDNDTKRIVALCKKFWDIYVSELSELSAKCIEVEKSHSKVRSILEESVKKSAKAGSTFAESILTSGIIEEVTTLADELLYNYASNSHTKFREHKVHELLCNELAKGFSNHSLFSNKQEIPNLPQGCIKRLLRKAEFPDGVSSHKPFKAPTSEGSSEKPYPNAQYAVIFGTAIGPALASQMPVPGIESSDIRRYACLPVSLDKEVKMDSLLDADSILPPTFESYAVVPQMKIMPFSKASNGTRISSDGWQVSLVSFVIPNAESSASDPAESSLYGVSLVFVKDSMESKEKVSPIRTEFVVNEASGEGGSESPISFASEGKADESTAGGGKSTALRQVKVSSALPVLNEKMKEEPWHVRIEKDEYHNPSNPTTIGLALVCNRNVIYAMRDTLSRLLFDFSKQPGTSGGPVATLSCQGLIDVLGGFSHKDIESASLLRILEPHLKGANASWVDRPITDQSRAFKDQAVRQLSDCLPPTPLALMFATALLEQKIILSSSRRSVLHAATTGLCAMLEPLEWSHLLVPLVPSTLAVDLIQYPAPFILGVPSGDADNGELLGNLPEDVTLVDLDVGRVILAPAFGKDNEMVRKSTDVEATAKALRSQILYLAHSLGTLFGGALRPNTWGCDAPSLGNGESEGTSVERLLSMSHRFINEILTGVPSCCFWIEEATQNYNTSTEPTVLFDEDRFFAIKTRRSTIANKGLFQAEDTDGDLALNLDDFDLILESFLRCQSMSTYISSRPKSDMVYC
ncbi:unnamed protein product [Cylindrotheca closterium]|uniref:Uncharacterized protein n=1 Tax=Cylindrotheca closterium TaxID=2856 RepID=A0AAD2JLA7_9STRA|nr:unnamed protein product [Cylindrotheca closterium]